VVIATLHVSTAAPGLRSRVTDLIATSIGRTDQSGTKGDDTTASPESPSRASRRDRFVSMPVLRTAKRASTAAAFFPA